MKNLQLIIFTVVLLLSFNANSALVILSSSETNASVLSLTSSLISANGKGSSAFEDKVEPDCCAAVESYFTVNFEVIDNQGINIDFALNSYGESYMDEAFLRIQKNDPLEYYLGAVTQGVDSSLGGDPWVTDYTSQGALNISREIFLSEGEYTLFASARSESEFGGSSYSFSLTAVPLPAAVWLFLSGIVGLLGFGWRKV